MPPAANSARNSRPCAGVRKHAGTLLSSSGCSGLLRGELEGEWTVRVVLNAFYGVSMVF